MNRRDTIIVAVLLNTAIIAVLLIMAVNNDEEVFYERPASTIESPGDPISIESPSIVLPSEQGPPGFEGMLGDYPSSPDDYFLVDDDLGLIPEKSAPVVTVPEKIRSSEIDEVKVVDIIVKKGDSLDKIARANGTTIDAIKQTNKLKTERLAIGQHLKVPVVLKKSAKTESPPAPASTPDDARYYTLKSGDTPWKIAKQQQVSMDDILRLNKLDEEKARNLKVGDKIRIR